MVRYAAGPLVRMDPPAVGECLYHAGVVDHRNVRPLVQRGHGHVACVHITIAGIVVVEFRQDAPILGPDDLKLVILVEQGAAVIPPRTCSGRVDPGRNGDRVVLIEIMRLHDGDIVVHTVELQGVRAHLPRHGLVEGIAGAGIQGAIMLPARVVEDGGAVRGPRFVEGQRQHRPGAKVEGADFVG